MQNGFSAREAVVNGSRVNFADYLAEKAVDAKLPLVADLFGVRCSVFPVDGRGVCLALRLNLSPTS
jgi:hypothetical protein